MTCRSISRSFPVKGTEIAAGAARLGPLRAARDRRLADRHAVGHRHGMRNDAGQLGQIARPIVVQQALPRLLGKAPGGLPRVDALPGKVMPQVVVHQHLDVLPAVAERGNTRWPQRSRDSGGRRRSGPRPPPPPDRRRWTRSAARRAEQTRTLKTIDIAPLKRVEQSDLGPQRQASTSERKRVPPWADSNSPWGTCLPSSTSCCWPPNNLASSWASGIPLQEAWTRARLARVLCW